MSKKVRVGVLGATGFTGEKLVELLIRHPGVELVYLTSRTPVPVPYAELFPRFSRIVDLKCEQLNIEKAIKQCDLLFLSLPHTVSMKSVPYLLKAGKKVVDLSADYRFKDAETYKKYYHVTHHDKANLKQAVYGLTELYRPQIKQANLVANPGCYPTAVILGLFPLLKEGLIETKVVVDAKSAISGAGRKAVIEHHYANVSNNLWAYKPFIHQHAPEVLSVVKDKITKSIKVSFTPHVVGVDAGIYATIYVWFKQKVKAGQLGRIYHRHYHNCPFLRIKENLPKLKEVVGTNFCDIGFARDESGKEAVIVACIDNLVKGAAGQAVQNMNLMLGQEETTGLL